MTRLRIATLVTLAIGVGICFFAAGPNSQDATGLPVLGDTLKADQVTQFFELALKNIHTEYPNKPSNVMAGPESVLSPKEMHPAFYGCFDWHSSVHGHWMLVRLLKRFPEHPNAQEVRDKLARSLTAQNLEAETAYFALEHNYSFERMYGWAWLFRLAIELDSWDDPQAKTWRQNLRPLEELLAKRAAEYLPKLTWPIRTGQHPDSGFALGQIFDYAVAMKDADLKSLVIERANHFYSKDVDYPTRFEPSGHDFFSSCLNEADLMRRVLSRDEFSNWLDKFLPGLANGEAGNLLHPVKVTDIRDGKLMHLAGLDLSRAWCMRGIASALPQDDPRRNTLELSASKHSETGFEYVFSGAYEGDHWLATFAIYLQTGVAIEP